MATEIVKHSLSGGLTWYSVYHPDIDLLESRDKKEQKSNRLQMLSSSSKRWMGRFVCELAGSCLSSRKSYW